MLLTFVDGDDIHNVWGDTRITASTLQHLRDCQDPGFNITFTERQADGSYSVFGYKCGKATHWKLFRAETADGEHFENVRVVIDSERDNLPLAEGHHWQHVATVSYSPELGRYLCLKNVGIGFDDPDDGVPKQEFATYALTSSDGESWQAYEGNPVYHEGDRWGAIWSSVAQRFISYNKGWLRNDHKRVNELVLDGIRTCCIRTSPDGFEWTPDLPNHYKHGLKMVGHMRTIGGPLVPPEYHIAPDEQDPPDLEFYAGAPFEYGGRFFLSSLNYAGSYLPAGVPPMRLDGHGPGTLDQEWWLSKDGLSWERCFRGVEAGAYVAHNPMVIGGLMMFRRPTELLSLPENRMTYVTTRANGVFETRTFDMPGAPLALNCRQPGSGFSNDLNEAYIMAELIDGSDRVVPGYEKEKCILQGPIDLTDQPLNWIEAANGKGGSRTRRDGGELKGQRLRLRFYFRCADIFSVSAQA